MNKLTRLAPGTFESVADDFVTYTLSKDPVALDNHRIFGWDTSRHPAPGIPFLFGHQTDTLPIGVFTSVWTEGDGSHLRGTVRFANHERARAVRDLIINGFMKGISVGFMPLIYGPAADTARATQGGLDIKRALLLEGSAVPVPSLAAAMVEARTTDLAQLATLPPPDARGGLPPDCQVWVRSVLAHGAAEARRQAIAALPLPPRMPVVRDQDPYYVLHVRSIAGRREDARERAGLWERHRRTIEIRNHALTKSFGEEGRRLLARERRDALR
jgi:hypothetical protein